MKAQLGEKGLCCETANVAGSIGKWQSTQVLLPGKSHGQRSLVGYSPWGRKELDTTERFSFLSFFLSFFPVKLTHVTSGLIVFCPNGISILTLTQAWSIKLLEYPWMSLL